MLELWTHQLNANIQISYGHPSYNHLKSDGFPMVFQIVSLRDLGHLGHLKNHKIAGSVSVSIPQASGHRSRQKDVMGETVPIPRRDFAGFTIRTMIFSYVFFFLYPMTDP